MKNLFLAMLTVLLLASAGARGQSLSASPSSLYSGQSVGASWSGITTPTTTDWIGLYVAGSADNAFVAWRYTDGNASGSAALAIPQSAAAGTYELRLFSNNGYTRLATSNGFTVQIPPPATLSESPSSAYASQAVTANWGSIFQPSGTDWIGLYAAGSADSEFVTFVYTGGTTAGSTGIGVPRTAAAGSYELRLFSDNGYTRLATSNAFTVQTPPPATLSASPSSLYAGQAATATWGSIFGPAATDWVGLYAIGAADGAFLTYVYTDGNASGNTSISVPLTAAAGPYELRLFSANGYTLLATSGTFTVQTPPPATLAASPSNVQPGGQLTAAWTNILDPSATDWIGLYLPSAADTAFVSWRYTMGTASGSAPFDIAAGVAPGTYQLRLFSNNGYARLATSANFTVGAIPPALHFIQVDHLNTPRAIFDQNRQLKWKWDQAEPFGVNTPDENPSGLGMFSFPVRYPGQYADPESGLHHNRYRDYDPVAGIYKESDPIGLLGGLNTYSYVADRPLTFVDPTGLINIYGNWCGPGGSGPVLDTLDQCCYDHDSCYDRCNATWKDKVFGTNPQRAAQMQTCDKSLCDCLDSVQPVTDAQRRGKGRVQWFFKCIPPPTANSGGVKGGSQ
jgi:RHS repeat-associated protein